MDEKNIGKDTMDIRILPDGSTEIDFFPISFSDFIIKYVYGKEERDLAEQFPESGQKIYCG